METRSRVPTTLMAAVGFLVAYGVLIVTQAVAFGAASDWADRGGLVRAVIRAVGVAVIAVSLLQLKRWAWWLAVVASGVLLALFLASLPFLLRFDTAQLPLGALSLAFFAATALSLAGALALLLARPTRSAILSRTP